MRKREQYEDCMFAEYIASSIDKAEQAISNITYSIYPEINMEVIKKIKQAIEILDDVLDREIFKP